MAHFEIRWEFVNHTIFGLNFKSQFIFYNIALYLDSGGIFSTGIVRWINILLFLTIKSILTSKNVTYMGVSDPVSRLDCHSNSKYVRNSFP